MAGERSPGRFWHQIGPSLRGPQFLLEPRAARHIEGFLNQARLVLIGCLLILVDTGLLPGVGDSTLLPLAAAGFGWAAIVALLVRYSYRAWIAIVIGLLDAVFVSGLIYLTGGPNSPLEGLYAVVIFAGIIRFTKVHSFLFTAAVILAYVEVAGRHPQFVAAQHASLVFTRATILAAAGMLAWFIAVEVERQRRAIVQARQELASLSTIELLTQRLNSSIHRPGIVGAVLDLAASLAPRAAIALALRAPDGFELAGTRGPWPSTPDGYRKWTEDDDDPAAATARSTPIGELSVVPLGGDPPLGRLYVAPPVGEVLRDSDRALLRRLAVDASAALQRADLLQQERERSDALQQLAEQNAELLANERDAVARLRQLARLKDNFILMLAHELRTPLTAIRGFAQLQARSSQARGDEDGYAGVILDRSNRMREIIDDVVDLSRMERDLLALDRLPVEFGALLEEVRTAAAQRGIVVQLETGGMLPTTKADGEKLHRALVTIVERAARCQRGGAPLCASVTLDGDELVLTILIEGDTPAQPPSEVFKEVPADQEGTPPDLALYVARNLIEAHGGRLAVEALDSGGRVVVRLPIDATARLHKIDPAVRLTA